MYGYKTFRELEKGLPKNDGRNGGETHADFVNRSLLRRLRRAETRLSKTLTSTGTKTRKK